MKLLIFAGLVAAASACCFPDVWTGNMGLQYAIYNETSQNGTYAEGSMDIFFDANKKMVAENQTLIVDDTKIVRQRIVMDYSQGISFVIRENGECSKHMLPQLDFNCLPDNATDKKPFNYGFGDNTVAANFYNWKMGPSTIYMTVTADSCVPISEDVFTRMGPIGIFQAMSYNSIKASITDAQAFYVPVSCTKNTPILPPLPGTGVSKRALGF